MAQNKKPEQTAVELLEKKLKTYLSWSSHLEEDFQQAKKMEKEQISNAYITGIMHPLEIEATKQSEQYYNDTYGTK